MYLASLFSLSNVVDLSLLNAVGALMFVYFYCKFSCKIRVHTFCCYYLILHQTFHIIEDHARIDEKSLGRVSGEGGLIPLTSQVLKQPCILRRKRRRAEQENCQPKLILPSSTPISSREPEEPKHAVIHNLLTPLKTPVKHLPFSPSRVS